MASIFFIGGRSKRLPIAFASPITKEDDKEMKPIHWRRTRFGRYLRHMPRAKHIRGTWLHRRLGDRLFDNELWHPTRQRFAAGMAVGAFFAMMPAPFQMLAAAMIAYFTRVNVPAAFAGTWISNPFTMAFCIYSQYWIGSLILGRSPTDVPTHDLMALIKAAPVPFFVGVIPVAMLLAAVVYPLTLVIWDWAHARLEARRLKRAERA